MGTFHVRKDISYAGSPPMCGINGPRTYDADMCKKAADAFGQLLSMVESGRTQYVLVDFKITLHYSIQFNKTG